MRVLVTGSAKGIGFAIAHKFLEAGHEVIGIDLLPCPRGLQVHEDYTHYQCDVRDASKQLLDVIHNINVLVNNAGVEDTADDIGVNLCALIDITETFGIQDHIQSIVNIAALSGHIGSEFPRYAASKGGVLSYTKNVAMRIAQYNATCNSISPGGVITSLNDRIIHDSEKWEKVMESTPLKRWASTTEIAEWVYFLCTVNRSMTGQDILIDNGESISFNFVW